MITYVVLSYHAIWVHPLPPTEIGSQSRDATIRLDAAASVGYFWKNLCWWLEGKYVLKRVGQNNELWLRLWRGGTWHTSYGPKKKNDRPFSPTLCSIYVYLIPRDPFKLSISSGGRARVHVPIMELLKRFCKHSDTSDPAEKYHV